MSKLMLDRCFSFCADSKWMLSNVAGWGTCCVGIFDSQNKRLLWLILIVTLTHCYLSSPFLFGTVEVYDKGMMFLAIRGEQRLAFPSFAKLCLAVMRLKALYRQDTKQAQLWLEDASHLNHALVTFHEVLKFCHCFAIVQPRNSTFTDRCKLWQHGTTTRKSECWSVRAVVFEHVLSVLFLFYFAGEAPFHDCGWRRDREAAHFERKQLEAAFLLDEVAKFIELDSWKAFRIQGEDTTGSSHLHVKSF